MRVPRFIQVGGHTYEIVILPFMPDNAAVTHRLQKVLINLEAPPTQRSVGLLHELLHIISEVYCSSRLGENDIDGIAQGLLQIVNQLGVEFDFEQRKQVGKPKLKGGESGISREDLGGN